MATKKRTVATKKLIVVHGMGQHDEASVKKEVEGALVAALSLYEPLKGRAVRDVVDVVPVAYNDFFENYRKQLKQHNGAIAEKLAKIDAKIPITVEIADRINGLEASIGEDSFFTTHWLDAILYFLTLLSEPICLRLAETIATSIAQVGGANVHVLGHSLGTAVVHDTLAKAFGPDHFGPAGRYNLSPIEHRLGGVHMVANVSRALQTFVKVGSSIVRPGPLGCTAVLVEYRHRLDPIPMVRSFNPTDNDGWVPHDTFKSAYSLIEPTSVTAANVHGLTHYLKNPAVHLMLFRLLFGFRPTKQQREAGEKLYLKDTVEGKAKALQSAFGDLRQRDSDALKALLDSARSLKDLVTGFGEKF